ncbi:hypothetical protein Tco_1141026 [Tanacetum coccineum]
MMCVLAHIIGGNEMAFRNFLYVKTDEDLTFLHTDSSLEFGTGSPYASISTKLPLIGTEPAYEANTEQIVENFADSGGSPMHQGKLVICPGSVAERIKDRKCRTRGGSSKPPVKRRLVQGACSSCATRQKTSSSTDDYPFLTIFDDDEGLPDDLELQDANACHLKISNITPLAWRGHLDNQLDVELLNLHDCYYAKQAIMDNAVNRIAWELLKVFEQMKGECDVLKEREKARDKECEEVKAKCEAAMIDFNNNPTVKVLHEKIAALLVEVAFLEAEKARLEAFEASLHQEVEDVKRDREEVVSKVVPYIAMELVHSNELGMRVGKLVSFVVFYWRCATFVEVAEMKEPFDLTKVKGYRPLYKKEHAKAGNDLAAVTFPFLSEIVADPSASVEALLLKKPPTLQHLTPMRTHALTPSS